jgi:hypothetical protein
MYHPNPPFYFDILAGNGFHNFDAWINWMPDWDQQNDIRTIWLNFRYNDDVNVMRSRFYTIMCFIAQKSEHVGRFKPILQNYYKEWHAGGKLFDQSKASLPIASGAGLSDFAAIGASYDKRSAFAREVIASLTSVSVAPKFAHPTAMSDPSPEQLSRFPPNESGAPYAIESVVLPVDSRPQADIPEQMIVGSPAREQLYL